MHSYIYSRDQKNVSRLVRSVQIIVCIIPFRCRSFPRFVAVLSIVSFRFTCFVLFISVRSRSVFLALQVSERERERETLRNMPYSDYLKRCVLHFHRQGLSPPAIADALAVEGMKATRQGMLKCVERTGSLARCPGSGRSSSITPAMKAVVDAQMREDDETTAIQLGFILRSRGLSISKSTVLRSRSSLGWTFRGSAYCQLIREANKTKRLEWARQYRHEAADGFLDLVFTDETSSSFIQLESHRSRKRGEAPRPKPK